MQLPINFFVESVIHIRTKEGSYCQVWTFVFLVDLKHGQCRTTVTKKTKESEPDANRQWVRILFCIGYQLFIRSVQQHCQPLCKPCCFQPLQIRRKYLPQKQFFLRRLILPSPP